MAFVYSCCTALVSSIGLHEQPQETDLYSLDSEQMERVCNWFLNSSNLKFLICKTLEHPSLPLEIAAQSEPNFAWLVIVTMQHCRQIMQRVNVTFDYKNLYYKFLPSLLQGRIIFNAKFRIF